VYDGDGNRVSKTVAGMTTTYLVDDQNPTGYAQVVYEAITGSTTFPRESSHTFTYGLERVLEIRNYQTQQSNLSQTIYFVYDGHGSVRALTDQTGTVTDTYDYDAFGNLLHSTGTTLNNYRFAGEQFDPDLHLYFNRARYLNVATGRFWNMDTFEGYLSDPSTLHKYTYCFGDSVNCVDPSGHDGDIISTAAYNAGNITIQSIQAVRYLQVLGAVGSLLIGYVAAPYIEDVFNKYKDRYVGFEYALAAALAEFWNHLRRWQSDPEWPKQGNHTIKIGIFSPALPPWTPVVTLFKGQLPLNLLAFRAKINLEVFEGGDAGRLCGIQYQIGQSTSGTGYFEFRADYMDYQDRSAPPKFGLHLHVNYVSNGERTKIDHMPF
jgi:RHS repeat-associated protein